MKNINDIDTEINSIKDRVGVSERVKDILNKVLYIKKQEIKVLERIVNAGLKYTYPEKDLSFKIEFEEKYSKIVPEFYLNKLLLKPPFIGDGGGVISVVGLLIYIAMIKITGKKIVLLDEVESMVDYTATNRLFIFLDEFASDNDITMLAITHKDLDYNSVGIGNGNGIELMKVGG